MFSSLGNRIVGNSDKIKKSIQERKEPVVFEDIGVMGKVAFIKSDDHELLRNLIDLRIRK